jgi:3'(2'), 5'-bisphosphate nucleotidase
MAYVLERRVAVEAVIKACRLCQTVQANLVSAETMAKKDRSPVTVADFGGQAVVTAEVTAALPDIPMVGEEDAGELRTEAAAKLKDKVVRHVNAILPDLNDEQVLFAIDYGTHLGGPTGRHWALDPIDGTKGFLRGDQYAVALGLIEDGQVVLGVLGCPNLPVDAGQPDGPAGCIFVGVKGQGAMMRTLDDPTEHRIHVADMADPARASFCESVESGHSKHSDSAAVAELLGVTVPPFRIDSQCKYAAIARGDSSIYLRLPTRADYQEKIWDHAAGWAVVTEAGGRVTDVTGKPLDFSIGRTLRDNKGVVATNGLLHDRVIAAVRQVLGLD